VEEPEMKSCTMPDGYSVSTHRERTIPPAQVKRRYELAGWWPKRRTQEIAAVLLGAPAVGAWHAEELEV
jgi:hypothetical protein